MSYTLEQVKKSFNAAADNTPFMYKNFLRPLSFYITFILLRLGIYKPNHVTIANLVVGLACLIFFGIGTKIFFLLGVSFYALFMLLDLVDGNMARVTDSATYYGKFLDGTVDALIESFLPFSISLGLYFLRYDIFTVIAGGFTSLLLLFAFLVVNRTALFNRWIALEERRKGNELEKLNPLKSNRFPLRSVANITHDIKIVVFLVAAIIEMNKLLMIIYLASLQVWALLMIVSAMLDANTQFHVYRKSKWDTRLVKDK